MSSSRRLEGEHIVVFGVAGAVFLVLKFEAVFCFFVVAVEAESERG